MLLYRTISGSRLYGTNRKDSDYDYFEIYDRAKLKQKITGSQDVTRMGFSDFVRLCDTGAHQYLEAMFAPKQEIDMFYDMRLAYRCNLANTVNLYRRTINKFGHHDYRRVTNKSKRIALKMSYELDSIMTHGRFNPRVSPELKQKMFDNDNLDLHIANQMNYLHNKYRI